MKVRFSLYARILLWFLLSLALVGGIVLAFVLMQFRLDVAWSEGSDWLKPEWNRGKQHPSILDLRRLFWRHQHKFSNTLRQLEETAKTPWATIHGRKRADLAA